MKIKYKKNWLYESHHIRYQQVNWIFLKYASSLEMSGLVA